MPIFKLRPKKYSDAEYVRGIAEGNDNLGNKLYDEWVKYFEEKCHNLFFNITMQDKEDIIQDAYIILFQKIRYGVIKAEGDKVMGRNGNPIKCSLTTYLTSVAVNLRRVLVRKNARLKDLDEIFTSVELQTTIHPSGDEDMVYSQEEQTKHEIIAKCLSKMAKDTPRCVEILTMFYYEKKSYEDILSFYAQKNDGPQSYRGLVTRKNKCMNTLRDNFFERYSKYLNS